MSPPLRASNARAHPSRHIPSGEGPRLPSTARIERALFHRARSASKEGTWLLPPYPSEGARCARTRTHRVIPPLLADCFSILRLFVGTEPQQLRQLRDRVGRAGIQDNQPDAGRLQD